MRVSIQKSTGKILEMQSHATEGTLLANAVAAGYAADDTEDRVVTAEEYAALRAAQPVPVAEQIARIEAASRPSDRFIREFILLLVDEAKARGINVVETPPLKALRKAEADVAQLRNLKL